MEQILSNISAAAPLLVPVLYTLLVAALLDTLSGIYAAIVSGTFSGEYLAEFVRSHVLQKVGPIMFSLLAGVGIGATDNAAGLALIGTAGVAGSAYLASVVAGVFGNMKAAGTKTKGLPSGVTPKAVALTATLDETETTYVGDQGDVSDDDVRADEPAEARGRR